MSGFNIHDVEIVSFPVPKRFLPEVVQALAKAMEAAISQVAPIVDWTKVDNMRKLRKSLSGPISIKLLDMTAAKPGEMISFEDVYKGTSLSTSQQARSSLGALTKVIKREFKVSYEDAKWPVGHHWGYHGDSQYYYYMTPDVAKAWIASEK